MQNNPASFKITVVRMGYLGLLLAVQFLLLSIILIKHYL